MRTVTFGFLLRREETLTANQRLHWAQRSKLTSALRNKAAFTKRQQRPDARMEAAVCDVTLAFPDARARDAANWHPTVKALVDGLVSGPSRAAMLAATQDWPYGLLPDDDWRHLEGPHLRIDGRQRSARGEVLVCLDFRPMEVQR